jgi:hypothetical protein
MTVTYLNHIFVLADIPAKDDSTCVYGETKVLCLDELEHDDAELEFGGTCTLCRRIISKTPVTQSPE